MERREVLRVLASAAALSALSPNKTLAAWSRVASGVPLSNELSKTHLVSVRFEEIELALNQNSVELTISLSFLTWRDGPYIRAFTYFVASKPSGWVL